MGHPYYRQAKFAGYRFQKKSQGEGSIASHEAAYLASKEFRTFAEEPRLETNGVARIGERVTPIKITKEQNDHEHVFPKKIFCQCWTCHSVMTVEASATQEIRCKYCNGPTEILTVDGVPT